MPSQTPEPSSDDPKFSVSDELGKKLGKQSKIVGETSVDLSISKVTSASDSNKIVDKHSGASTELAG